MQETIFAQIRKESDDFFNAFISPVPGYSFNQYEMVKLCHLYYNSKFEDGTDYYGRPKLFFNIVNPACEVASKMLNVDTKNIRLWPLNPKSHFATYLLEKELKQWLKTSEFADVLNQMAEEAPVYGSVFLEKTTKGARVVDIRRLICDQSVEHIEDSRFVTTVHYMTPTELRATGWDNVEQAIEMFGNTAAMSPFEDQEGDINQQVSTPYIKVWRRYGEVPEYWLKGKGEKMKKSLFICVGADKQIISQETGKPVGEQGLVLFKSEWNKEWPFRDFHYTKSKGRLLGVGVIEKLLDVQIRVNEMKNQKRISMEVSSLHLFQSKDKQLVRNVLTDLENGDLLISPNGIEPVANEERNLSAFKDEEASYAVQVDKLTFAYDAVRGEAPASSTPLGTTQIVTAQSTSVFGFKRENLSNMIREFFNELVMKQLLRDLNKEHIMRFTGSPQELMKIDQAAAEIQANDYVKEQVLNGKAVDTNAVKIKKDLYLSGLKKLGSDRFLAIKEAFYKDAEFDFDYIVDNEQADPQILAQNLQRVIGDLASNETILQDPRLKLLYFKFAQIIGINPAEMELADQEATNMQQQLAQQQGQPQLGQPTQQPEPNQE